MYLVELRPGKEELYRTGDDLALAIRDGEVDARSRIYHRSTAKWISITLHPQYKAIVAGQTDESTPRPVRKAWGLLHASLSGQAEDSAAAAEPADKGDGPPRWQRPLGLGFASVLLMLGLQLAFSGPRPPWARSTTPAVVWLGTSAGIQTTAGVAPIERDGAELISLASTAELPSKTMRALPRAPRLRAKALRAALQPGETRLHAVAPHSVDALLKRYEEASDSVYARLVTGVRVARLNRLFASPRLTPGGGVSDTRLSLAGAMNFIRVFRQQQTAIDEAYQDTVSLLAKQHRWTPKEVRRWYSRPPRQETPTLELLSGSLISSIDTMLGVLDAHAGAYKLRGTAIAFEDPHAGQAYGVLRRRIREQIDSAIAAGAATLPGPAGLLLQAIGTSTLPRET